MMQRRRGELYRIPSKGKIAGVCAGLADYFSWEPWLVRILVVSGVLLGMGWFIVIYIAAWFILNKPPVKHDNIPNKNTSQYGEKSTTQPPEFVNESIKVKSRIWQAGEPPQQAFKDITKKFKSLEKELQKIERYVTSPEFTVSREINKL